MIPVSRLADKSVEKDRLPVLIQKIAYGHY